MSCCEQFEAVSLVSDVRPISRSCRGYQLLLAVIQPARRPSVDAWSYADCG
jgi:hypothetical protein